MKREVLMKKSNFSENGLNKYKKEMKDQLLQNSKELELHGYPYKHKRNFIESIVKDVHVKFYNKRKVIELFWHESLLEYSFSQLIALHNRYSEKKIIVIGKKGYDYIIEYRDVEFLCTYFIRESRAWAILKDIEQLDEDFSEYILNEESQEKEIFDKNYEFHFSMNKGVSK